MDVFAFQINDDIQKNISQLLELPNETYFKISKDEVIGLRSKMARLCRPSLTDPFDARKLANTPKAVSVGAPKEVYKDKQVKIPVLLGSIISGQRNWEVEFKQNCWLIVFEASTGSVSLRRPAFLQRRTMILPRSKEGPAPDKTNASGISSGLTLIDLRNDMFTNLPWNPGHYFLAAIYYDCHSNTKQIEVVSENRKYPVAIPNMNERVQRYNNSKVASPETGRDTGEVGATMAQQKLYHVSVDLPITDALVVENSGSTYFLFTIAMFELDSGGPVQIDMAAPVEVYTSSSGKHMFKANFEFDIFKAYDYSIPNSTYMSYLVSGPYITGPNEIRIP